MRSGSRLVRLLCYGVHLLSRLVWDILFSCNGPDSCMGWSSVVSVLGWLCAGVSAGEYCELVGRSRCCSLPRSGRALVRGDGQTSHFHFYEDAPANRGICFLETRHNWRIRCSCHEVRVVHRRPQGIITRPRATSSSIGQLYGMEQRGVSAWVATGWSRSWGVVWTSREKSFIIAIHSKSSERLTRLPPVQQCCVGMEQRGVMAWVPMGRWQCWGVAWSSVDGVCRAMMRR